MKIYHLPSVPSRPRYHSETVAEIANREAATVARTVMLLDLAADVSPLLSKRGEDRYDTLISFVFERPRLNPEYSHAYTLRLTRVDGTGQIEARLREGTSLYGSSISFKRFAVKGGVIDNRIVAGLRELAEEGDRHAANAAQAEKDVKADNESCDTRQQANVRAAEAAGLTVTREGYHELPVINAGPVTFTIDYRGVQATGFRLPIERLPEFVALFKTLE